jgi:hypothetical protein
MHPKSNRSVSRKTKDPKPARKLNNASGEREPAGAEKGKLPSAPDPKRNLIFLEACRIVIGGYKAEISRMGGNPLLVRAAYEVLRRFLEREFSRPSQAA